ALFEVASPRIREPDLSCCPHEQAYAQARFQTRDRAADRSRRNARGGRGERETLEFGGETKKFDTAEEHVLKLTLHGFADVLSDRVVRGGRRSPSGDDKAAATGGALAPVCNRVLRTPTQDYILVSIDRG